MKLNAVKFKDKKSFDKNKTKLNVREVHEPFGIIVFADEQEVKPDFTKVSSVNTLDESLEAIPTGLAICIAHDFIAGETFFQTNKVVIKDRYKVSKTFVVEINVSNFEDFKKSNIFGGQMKSEVNEIEKINLDNQNRYDIDEILDKISAFGMKVLTPGELAFLDKYSNEKGNKC